MPTDTDTREDGEDELIGETIDGRFLLDQKLGEGAVGRVYRSTQMSIDRPVAIKVLHGEFRRDDSYRERFRREANAISSFNHPNIVRLVDYGEDDDLELTYLAMEFVEGLELYEVLGKGRVDVRLALEITSQIASGLAAAHEADIIHRDLKPSNILLVSGPGGIFQAKVLDFGVAFPRNEDVRMTTDGNVLGTPAYMAPEQTRGDPVRPPSDLYSLGAVLHEMVTGTLLFDGESSLEVMMKHYNDEPPRLTDAAPTEDPPDGLQELLDALLRKSPEDRFESGEEVRQQIKSIRARNGWRDIEIDTSANLDNAVARWLLPSNSPRWTVPSDRSGPMEWSTDRNHRNSSTELAPPETPTEPSREQTNPPDAGQSPSSGRRRREDVGSESAPARRARGAPSDEITHDVPPDDGRGASFGLLANIALGLAVVGSLLASSIALYRSLAGSQTDATAGGAAASAPDTGIEGQPAEDETSGRSDESKPATPSEQTEPRPDDRDTGANAEPPERDTAAGETDPASDRPGESGSPAGAEPPPNEKTGAAEGSSEPSEPSGAPPPRGASQERAEPGDEPAAGNAPAAPSDSPTSEEPTEKSAESEREGTEDSKDAPTNGSESGETDDLEEEIQEQEEWIRSPDEL